MEWPFLQNIHSVMQCRLQQARLAQWTVRAAAGHLNFASSAPQLQQGKSLHADSAAEDPQRSTQQQQLQDSSLSSTDQLPGLRKNSIHAMTGSAIMSEHGVSLASVEIAHEPRASQSGSPAQAQIQGSTGQPAPPAYSPLPPTSRTQTSSVLSQQLLAQHQAQHQPQQSVPAPSVQPTGASVTEQRQQPVTPPQTGSTPPQACQTAAQSGAVGAPAAAPVPPCSSLLHGSGRPRRLEVRLVRSSPELVAQEFPLYKRYQIFQHGDLPSKVTVLKMGAA